MSVPMVGRGPAASARVHVLDAIVVGAGGAGLYAALELKRGLGTGGRVGVVSKLYPTRSHTGAAQGGVCAALGNTEEDHWEWHWWDTVKGGDYLVDQDAAEVMCRDAVQTIRDLEHLGLPFDRTPEGLIDQRRFGGHSRNHGEAPVRRVLLLGRPHGPRHPPDPVPAVHPPRGDVLRRVPGPGPAHARRAGRTGERGRGRAPGDRGADRVPVEGRAVRDRRLRDGLQGHVQRPHPDR